MMLDELLDSLSSDGRDFERLCRWLLESTPEYAARLRHVWLWNDWPGRWGRDAGIDLVAEDRDGGLWAVQAKHYDPGYAIKKADLDSFLSESSRPGFSYRLLIASTDHLGPTARRTLNAQEKPVGTLLRSDLATLGLVWPQSLTELRPARQRAKQPFPHQRVAVGDIMRGLATEDRGQVVMACGTGKTLVARFLHDEMSSRRTLVLVPSLSLLKQTLREWLAVGTFDYLAVCSDDTVTPDQSDAVVSATSELGVPVTTDPADIATFLRSRRGGVVFATYQSSPQIAAAQAERVPAFDLVVADEAHRCAGPEAGVFATVLDPKKIKARKRVFMTATPRYFTGRVKKAAAEADWEVASMDDRAKFGPVLHRLPFAEAIKQDLLSDYQVVVVGVTDDSYRDMADRGVFVTTDGDTVTDARTLARQIGLLRAMRNHNLRRVVSFHTRIDSASRFARSLLDVAAWMPSQLRPVGDLWADHVSGRMTTGERETRINRLRAVGDGERGVLTNARCLSEGVDVPTLDGVAFIDPRRSQVDVVQAVGRAIRRADDKTVGTIVIPVFVDAVGDPADALDSSEFDRVWQIVKALRDHDDSLAEELDGLRRELGRRSSLGEMPTKILLDLPSGVGVDFAHAFDTRLIETATPNWEFWYGLLERYAARERQGRVPKRHIEDGYQLGQWANNQRAAYRAGRLSEDRIARLSALPRWEWDLLDADWERAYSRLERFVAREGHALVPQGHAEDGYPLGQWVGGQRTASREGRLSDKRRARLAALSGWDWKAFDAQWEKRFLSLERFAARERHTRVPKSHREDGYLLVGWVVDQRTAYRAGHLSAERAARLAALPGWEWEPYDGSWDEGLAFLERFADREHNTRVPARHVEDGFPLAQWVSHQRRARRVGRLSDARTARLVALPGWVWNTLDADWEEGHSYLARFAAREGHTRVPKRHRENGYALRDWIGHQRTAYRAGRLSDERIARLQDVPGWEWDPFDTAWEEGYARTASFATRGGHSRVGKRHIEDGFRLGQWVQNQRTAYRRHLLSADRAARLAALPGWVWNTLDADWEEGLVRLERFGAREGHTRVPKRYVDDDYPLGQWALAQRGAHRAGQLSEERSVRLAALPVWQWSPLDADWEEGFGFAKNFAAREHHTRVPQKHVEEGFALGQWIGHQRAAYRAGRLSDQRAARLEALPGWVWVTRQRQVTRAGALESGA